MNDTQQYTMVACAHCSMPFAVTKDFATRRMTDHDTFYCPTGHPQNWRQETEEERLRKLADYRANEMVRLRNELEACHRRCKRAKKK